MSDSFQNFIDGINTYTLWNPLNIKFPGMAHIKIPDKLKDIKVFPMDTLMAELPLNNEVQPMESLPLVGSLWFYVFLILAMIIVFGICIMKRKTIKKLGYKCRGCWSGCRKRGGDRDEESSGRNVLSGVHPDQRNSQETIEMNPIVKDTTTPKKPRRYGKPRRSIADAHAIGPITEELAYQLTGENRNSDYPRPESYGPDPDLAREYLAERALMSKK